jgi:hypothetical protein
LFCFTWEECHGTKILEEGIGQSRTRDEEAQGRYIEERQVRQEGQESQTGNRNRSVGGKARGKESPSEEEFEQEFKQAFEQEVEREFERQEAQQEKVGAEVKAIALALVLAEATVSRPSTSLVVAIS